MPPDADQRCGARLRVADVALFYGERSGGIRTYLDAKADYARRSGSFDHHLLVPGPRETHHDGRHELPSLRLAASNGYRLPLGVRGLRKTLDALRPDIVLLHDPFWRPVEVARAARRLGALVVGVYHADSAQSAEGLPGPSSLYHPPLRAWWQRAYRHVDALMSAGVPADAGRRATLLLRFGLDPVFRPRAGTTRADHVLYVGRFSREKGICELLEAAAASPEPWPLHLVGAGPQERAIRARAAQLGLGGRLHVESFIADRSALAQAYARASCLVMPGRYETFGLVALEAAAVGTRVVASATAPAARVAGELADTFTPGDVQSLSAAIERARRRARDPRRARSLGRRLTWDAAFDAELADLRQELA